MMTKEEKEIYERARKEGDGRFGVACKNELLRDGVCVMCGRKVFEKKNVKC